MICIQLDYNNKCLITMQNRKRKRVGVNKNLISKKQKSISMTVTFIQYYDTGCDGG